MCTVSFNKLTVVGGCVLSSHSTRLSLPDEGLDPSNEYQQTGADSPAYNEDKPPHMERRRMCCYDHCVLLNTPTKMRAHPPHRDLQSVPERTAVEV